MRSFKRPISHVLSHFVHPSHNGQDIFQPLDRYMKVSFICDPSAKTGHHRSREAWCSDRGSHVPLPLRLLLLRLKAGPGRPAQVVGSIQASLTWPGLLRRYNGQLAKQHIIDVFFWREWTTTDSPALSPFGSCVCTGSWVIGISNYQVLSLFVLGPHSCPLDYVILLNFLHFTLHPLAGAFILRDKQIMLFCCHFCCCLRIHSLHC